MPIPFLRPVALLSLSALATLAVVSSPPALAQEALTAACVDGDANGFRCSDVDLVGRIPRLDLDIEAFPTPPTCNDIWGWTDPQTGIEYALVGTSESTVFVSLATPSAPQIIGTLPTQTSITLWRDIKTRGNHAYIVSEADGHGMQVFDLTRLRDVTAPPVLFEADVVYTGAGSAHNIVIDEALPYAFLVGARQGGFACNGGGLHIVDISDPTAPTFAGCFDGDGYTHDAQCVRYSGPDADYQGDAVCFSSNGSFGTNDVLSISNVTDVESVTSISRTSYPFPGYAHQGWLTEDQRYFLMNDEFDEGNRDYPGAGRNGFTRTLIFDVSDLDDPVFAGAYIANVSTSDHNLYIRGNYVYQSNYESGLRIYELTDLANAELTLVGSFDTFPAGNLVSFSGQWSNYPFFESGLVIANDQSNGLFVLRSPVLTTADEPTPDAAALGLSAAYPNPFQQTTSLTLALDRSEAVRVGVYDLLGREVARLFEGDAVAGTTLTLTFDGHGLSSGTYVVRVVGESFAETRRLTLAR
ncbi:MAG: choice-of-anchor B family protein [Bacteroidota bacterium]